MDGISFLNIEDVLNIHLDQIFRYGGDASLRDLSLLESAISQPAATFDGVYLHRFPFEMAAAYLFHIVMNHPFVDGNKRTGTVAALVFLDWHNVNITAETGSLAELTIAVASGNASKQDVVEWLKEHVAKPMS